MHHEIWNYPAYTIQELSQIIYLVYWKFKESPFHKSPQSCEMVTCERVIWKTVNSFMRNDWNGEPLQGPVKRFSKGLGRCRSNSVYTILY